MNELLTLGGRLFNSSKRKHVLTRTESYPCKVNTLGTFVCNFSMFLRFLKEALFRKLLTESERRDRFYSGKFLNIIEHVSYSIKYCKISLPIYLGSRSLSNAGCVF